MTTSASDGGGTRQDGDGTRQDGDGTRQDGDGGRRRCLACGRPVPPGIASRWCSPFCRYRSVRAILDHFEAEERNRRDRR